ncbi:MAG: sensor histidine kinase [Nitrospirota bacterium]|nr:sensor histidine kinase [Nitrospirota bacterium]
MKLSHRITIAVIAAIIIGALFLYTRKLTGDVLSSHTMISEKISRIDTLDRALDDEILRSGFLLYHNYDAINDVLKDIYQQLAEISGLAALKDCPKTLALLKEYEKETTEKEKQIRVFQTVNSPIKNSAMYIPRLELKFREEVKFADDNYLRQLASITSTIFLARNSLDTGFVDEIKKQTELLRCYKFKDKAKQDFNEAFIAHANVFGEFFPAYSESMSGILNSGSKKTLQQTMKVFSEEERGQGLRRLNMLSLVLLAAFWASVALIIVYVVQADKQRRARLEADKRHFAEKEKMLKELHDGLGGSLSNAAMLVDMVRRETNPEKSAAQLNHLKNITADGLAELREIIWSLDGEESTLGSTVAHVQEKVLGRMEMGEIDCKLEVSLDNEHTSVSPMVRLNIVRIIKESLTNVMKHAAASNVHVSVVEKRGRLTLGIRDNGKGFDPAALRGEMKTGYGMRNMRKRCEEMGAELAIDSAPSKGTEIKVSMELPATG